MKSLQVNITSSLIRVQVLPSEITHHASFCSQGPCAHFYVIFTFPVCSWQALSVCLLPKELGVQRPIWTFPAVFSPVSVNWECFCFRNSFKTIVVILWISLSHSLLDENQNYDYLWDSTFFFLNMLVTLFRDNILITLLESI